ncbi:MAG: hypothetical protein V3T00_00670 [bacterium]
METASPTPAPPRAIPAEPAGQGGPSPLRRVLDLLENETVLGYTLMVPALLLILTFIAYPFGIGVWLSFSDKLVGQEASYIGVENFSRILQSQIFTRAAWNTILFTAV